jgi:hypothetical protein
LCYIDKPIETYATINEAPLASSTRNSKSCSQLYSSKTKKSLTSYQCELCGKICGNAGGLTNHTKSCQKYVQNKNTINK